MSEVLLQDRLIHRNNQKNQEIAPHYDDQSETELQRCYDGACVLVTGATGFMGKVLIEKLLRSCPGLRTVFLLVRQKRGKNIEERIDDLISSPCFDRLKRELPKFHTKLVAIAGDIGSVGLSISASDLQRLQKEVTIVFHVAATVRFDEPFKLAVEQNVRGTREVLTLCRSLRLLKAVIHVSTAYANCPRFHIAEQLYDPPLDCDTAIRMAEELDEDTVKAITPKLLGNWPNTYSFTKAISEDVVKRHGVGLPIGVFRPAVVVCTNEEPMPGWIDNLYGPTGVIVGVAGGLMRTLHVKRGCPANVVPCDMVINAMIASPADVIKRRLNSDELPIYNYIAPECNKITWSDYIDKYMQHGADYPTSRAIWYYYLVLASSRHLYLLLRLMLHTIPALIMDMGFVMTGHKPQMVRIYEKIHKFSDVIAYFGVNTWHFDDEYVQQMWAGLSARDKQLFPFDMRTLSWDSFIAGSILGMRQYIIKDDPANVPAARVRMRKLYYLHRFTQIFLTLFSIWLAWLLLDTLARIQTTSTSSH